MDAIQSQQQIVEAIDIVVKNRLQQFPTTNSLIGVVLSDPIGFNVGISINNESVECSIPEHLHSWIQKDDIVMIQDLYNNGQKRVVTGKLGQLQKSPSIVIHDTDKDKLISGRDGMFNENGDKVTYGTMGE